MRINAMLFILLASLAIVNYASAAGTNIGTCNYTVAGSNGTYSLQGGCPSEWLVFAQGAGGNRVLCTDSSSRISGISFGNNTYNNTMMNCTFENAQITSMRKAFNNIISPRGGYSLNFLDNYSNIALGYHFTFIPRSAHGGMSTEAFASVAPYDLSKHDLDRFNNQNLDMGQMKAVAAANNFTLPRFGVYPPSSESIKVTFALETLQISRNGTKSFNPYWFICPYWGYDILSYYKFNLTSDASYTPMFLSPDMPTNIQLPDNTDVFWNFTVVNYSNATNVTAYMFSGYQFEPPKTVSVVNNFSFASQKFSYNAGVQDTGIHQFIAQLRSTGEKSFEQSNSTTLNYAIGLSFCTEYEPAISIPGYYSMAFPTLSTLDVYYPSGKTCGVPVAIVVNDVTIDCKGGTINSTKVDFLVLDSSNVVVENCKLFGDALSAMDSEVLIANSTLTANNQSNIAFSAHGSEISLINTSISGYGTYSDLVSSSVSLLGQNNATNGGLAQGNSTQESGTAGTGYASYIPYLIVLLGASGVALIIYSMVCRRNKRKR